MNVVDNWTVKRKDVYGIDNNPSQASRVDAKKKITCYDDNTTYFNNENSNNKIPNIILVDGLTNIYFIALKQFYLSIFYGYNVKSFTESKEALKHIIELDSSS